MTYREKYPSVSDRIECEWNENVVNIEHLTKCVVEWIKQFERDGFLLSKLNAMDADIWPVNAILYELEPDCVNGTSHRGSWIHANKNQLKELNRLLIQAYNNDIPAQDTTKKRFDLANQVILQTLKNN